MPLMQGKRLAQWLLVATQQRPGVGTERLGLKPVTTILPVATTCLKPHQETKCFKPAPSHKMSTWGAGAEFK